MAVGIVLDPVAGCIHHVHRFIAAFGVNLLLHAVTGCKIKGMALHSIDSLVMFACWFWKLVALLEQCLIGVALLGHVCLLSHETSQRTCARVALQRT